ncbi:MAG: hypothetical protein HY721_02380 [Planctomycetes bacterium]|nr:hypothetical protein [Planctomycetota bacterium]
MTPRTPQPADSRLPLASQVALDRAVSLVKSELGLEIEYGPDRRSFRGALPAGASRPGVRSVEGSLEPDGTLQVHVEVLTVEGKPRVDLRTLYEGLRHLSKRCALAEPVEADGRTSYIVKLRLAPTTLSMAPLDGLRADIRGLDAIAAALREQIHGRASTPSSPRWRPSRGSSSSCRLSSRTSETPRES